MSDGEKTRCRNRNLKPAGSAVASPLLSSAAVRNATSGPDWTRGRSAARYRSWEQARTAYDYEYPRHAVFDSEDGAEVGLRQNELHQSDLAISSARPSRAGKTFSPEQVGAILNAAVDPWCTIFAVAVMTGMRPGEVLGLSVDDLDFEGKRIYITALGMDNAVVNSQDETQFRAGSHASAVGDRVERESLYERGDS